MKLPEALKTMFRDNLKASAIMPWGTKYVYKFNGSDFLESTDGSRWANCHLGITALMKLDFKLEVGRA